MKGGCSMDGTKMAGHDQCPAGTQAAANVNAMSKAVLPQPVQAVFDGYIKVQTALAEDSVPGFREAAGGLTKAIRSDSEDMLPAKVSQQAEALARASDLATARAAFKSLSESLIQYLQAQKVPPGTYHEAYCAMAKASWLQTDKTISNPYMGKGMLRCGQFKS